MSWIASSSTSWTFADKGDVKRQSAVLTRDYRHLRTDTDLLARENMSDIDPPDIRDMEDRKRSGKIQMNVGTSIVILTAVLLLVLENYFNSNPTVEDLYNGSSSRTTLTYAICFPVILGCLGWVISVSLKMRKLETQLIAARQNLELRKIRVATESSSTSRPDVTEQLIRLNELFKSGVITSEEFEKMKKNLIDDAF
jgi:hypothetical protein